MARHRGRTVETALRTPEACQLWRGRKAKRGKPGIPGMRQFNLGANALRSAVNRKKPGAAELDAAIRDGIASARRSVDGWDGEIRAFVDGDLSGAKPRRRAARDHEPVVVWGVRSPATDEVAALIEAFDAAVARAADSEEAAFFMGVGQAGRKHEGEAEAAENGGSRSRGDDGPGRVSFRRIRRLMYLGLEADAKFGFPRRRKT